MIKNANSILSVALRTIKLESSAVSHLEHFIDAPFENTIQQLHQCKGRIIISGIGKSAIIAQKIVATLNSTGTPSLFMHAADAIHGDLGMIQQNDAIILISKSGESAEIKILLPLIKNKGNFLVGMVGNINSYLAKMANAIINVSITQEACPNNLAPTCSTTTQMVMGDVLAICLMELNGFDGNDFAKLHPGGTLGKKLHLTVNDICIHNEKPLVLATATIKETILEITKKRMGATAVVNPKNNIVGIITDGDLRRMLEKNEHFEKLTAQDIANKKPKTIFLKTMAIDALEIMRKNDISQLIVIDNDKYIGMIHVHDLIKEGIVS